MSWYNSIGDLLGDVKKAAPFAAAIPVIGPAVSAGLSHLPGGDALKGAASHLPGLQAVGDFLGNHGGDVLAGAQGVNAAMLGKKSSDYANDAMGMAQANWNDRAPLRAAGQQGMLDPGQGIAAKLAAIPNHSIYGKPQLAPAAPQGAPPTAPALAPAQGGIMGRLAGRAV